LVVSRNFRTLGFLPSGRRRVLRRCVEERTLRRRLKEEGATFRQILIETRGEVAVQLLENSELTIASIASILRYDDPTAFSRAFKSWSGVSPARWRKDRQDTGS
jgi:AraC-like DNA-binding protein